MHKRLLRCMTTDDCHEITEHDEKALGCTDESVANCLIGSTCAFTKMVSDAIADKGPGYRNLGGRQRTSVRFLLSDTSLLGLDISQRLQADHEL